MAMDETQNISSPQQPTISIVDTRPPVTGIVDNAGRIINDLVLNMRATPGLMFCLALTALVLVATFFTTREAMKVRHGELMEMIGRCTPNG